MDIFDVIGDCMKVSKRVVLNLLFILFGVIICTYFISVTKVQEQEIKEHKLEGIEVYLEGEEISALYMAEDSLWVGGRDGVKKIDVDTGEVLGYVLDDLELIYAAEI